MRTLEPGKPVRIGAMAITVVVLVTAVGQSFTSVPVLFARPSYYGQFTDTGGLNKGDKVRIAGIDVGSIEQLKIDGNHVVIKFSTGDATIGTESRLRIRTDTILGRKALEIESRGTQKLRPGAVLPLSQGATPYQIYDAFFDVTKAAAGWNIDPVKQSLKVLTQIVDQTYPHLSPALDAAARFADTIGKRDDQIKHLLGQANEVTSILGNRSGQIDRLLVNTQTLLATVNKRGRAISTLLDNISQLSAQVRGVIDDNPKLNHVLEQLHTLSDLLVKHKDDLAHVLTTLSYYLTAFSEALSSGPFFKLMIANLLPYQVLQPWVDAAFKKRGIDPENFWRSAGLPAFRFPDPNGTRLPNGAPPPAPPILEGTPDHPGPAVAPGSPCSYTPPPELLPRPGNPMPCAGIDQGQGPFGPNGPYPDPPDVHALPPNPNGMPPTPGINIAGRPGDPPPDLPGTPVPLPPNAPPGARTENLAPARPTPPLSTFAPVLPPMPSPPPGPGPQLPAPFITPDGAGGSQN